MANILHIDLHDFLVAVERKHDPSLIGRPLVIGGQPTGWGRVVAVSQEAADRGVKPGMSLSVAASRCPSAIFLDGAFDRYLDASAAIDELLREPGVPVEWTSIDSVFLDVTPAAQKTPTQKTLTQAPAAGAAPRQIAERLQTALRDRLGFETACGIASTKIAAQIASRLARPAGLLYVLPGYEERLLAPLDVAMLPDLPLGFGPRLQRAGVLTLGHLAAMDLQAAETLLGRRAAELARLARGLDDRSVDGTAPPRSIAREVTLPQPTQSPAELESMTQYLAETLAGRLRRMGCFAQTITVRLRSGPIERPFERPVERTVERTVARSTSLREATAMDGDLVAAAHALLHLLRRPSMVGSGAIGRGAASATRMIVGISVVLSNLHQGGAQLPLFPLSPAAATRDTWTDLRGRAGFRALVHGRFATEPAARTRRAG